MNENIILDIKTFINSYQKMILPDNIDWFKRKEKYYNYLQKLLKNLDVYLKNKYEINYSELELKEMIKLYLLYPDDLPYKLKDLSWNIIKIIIKIFDEDKRDFYIDLCYFKNINENTLLFYLKNDIYEKFLYFLSKNDKYEYFTALDYSYFLDRVIKIQEIII